MVTLRQDAEDLLQDVLVRVFQSTARLSWRSAIQNVALRHRNPRVHGLQEFAGPGHSGQELVQIEVVRGVEVTPDSLFDARLNIVREAAFPESRTSRMHDLFFEGLTRREEGHA